MDLYDVERFELHISAVQDDIRVQNFGVFVHVFCSVFQAIFTS